MRGAHIQFVKEMETAKAAFARQDYDGAFHSLERAHILGQLRFIDHVISHIWMLRVAIARADRREVWGQVLRLGATVPGHLFGWLPIGNTGGADVSPLRPMPIPPDLQLFFDGFSLRRQIVRQSLIVFGIAVAALAVVVRFATPPT